MKQMKIMLVSVLAVLTMGMAAAQNKKLTAPDWMLNSKIHKSNLNYGKVITIGEIVQNIDTETKVSFVVSGDNLKLICEKEVVGKNGSVDISFDATFVCTKKYGTCYVSEVNLISQALYKEERAKCANPNDEYNYGMCLGYLKEFTEGLFYKNNVFNKQN